MEIEKAMGKLYRSNKKGNDILRKRWYYDWRPFSWAHENGSPRIRG